MDDILDEYNRRRIVDGTVCEYDRRRSADDIVDDYNRRRIVDDTVYKYDQRRTVDDIVCEYSRQRTHMASPATLVSQVYTIILCPFLQHFKPNNFFYRSSDKICAKCWPKPTFFIPTNRTSNRTNDKNIKIIKK